MKFIETVVIALIISTTFYFFSITSDADLKIQLLELNKRIEELETHLQ